MFLISAWTNRSDRNKIPSGAGECGSVGLARDPLLSMQASTEAVQSTAVHCLLPFPSKLQVSGLFFPPCSLEIVL